MRVFDKGVVNDWGGVNNKYLNPTPHSLVGGVCTNMVLDVHRLLKAFFHVEVVLTVVVQVTVEARTFFK